MIHLAFLILFKQHPQVTSALLSDLKAALQDLCCELLKEYRAGQHISQQFAEAKAAWTVERTELRSRVSRVRNANSANLTYLMAHCLLLVKNIDCSYQEEIGTKSPDFAISETLD